MYKRGNPTDNEFNTKNLKLIEAIIKDVGYSKKINWDEISEPYSPNWYLKAVERQESINEFLLQFGKMVTTAPPADNSKK